MQGIVQDPYAQLVKLFERVRRQRHGLELERLVLERKRNVIDELECIHRDELVRHREQLEHVQGDRDELLERLEGARELADRGDVGWSPGERDVFELLVGELRNNRVRGPTDALQ